MIWGMFVVALAGCGDGRIIRQCVGSGTSSDLVQSAALFRVDLYAADVRCDGPGVADDAPMPLLSRSFAKGAPITLDVPPGRYTIALTAWADADGKVVLGSGCVAATEFAPGAEICLDLPVDGLDLSTPTDLTPPRDLRDRIDGGNVCPPGATFCDDFEDGLLYFPDREVSGPGQILADDVRPLHGSLALHALTQVDATDASTDPYNRERAKRGLTPTTGAGTTFALRAYVWFRFVTGTPEVRLFQLSGAGSSSIALGLQSGKWAIGSSWTAPASTTPVTQGSWACVEWLVDLGASGRVQIFVDGTSVLDNTQQTIDPASPYDTFLAGLRAEKQGAAEVFIDDLVYGTQRIGCPAP